MCEEREGEEGRGAGQNACARSCVEATGGIPSQFLGERWGARLGRPKNNTIHLILSVS
jgi:hypothetical protein